MKLTVERAFNSKKQFILLLTISFLEFLSQASYSQWRKLWDFNDRVDVIYFLSEFGDSNTGFVGVADFEFNYKGNGQRTGSEIWKTTDGGISWKPTGKLPFLHISDIRFKDLLTGWASVRTSDTIPPGPSGACYKTTNGGETWFPVLQSTKEFIALHYNQSSKKLFVSSWERNSVSLVSDDEGFTWSTFSSQTQLGYSFSDDHIGFVSSAWSASYLRTFDGGFIWETIPFNIEAYQPIAVKGTSSFFALCEPTAELYRSNDFGSTWYRVYQFPTTDDFTMNGHIDQYQNTLIVNKLFDGFLLSADSGYSWYNICGPWIRYDTRFCVNGSKIYAADSRHMNNTLGSGLWVNHTGKGAGPRLRIQNNSENLMVNKHGIADIYYTDSAYYETLDSISFSMNISGEMLGYEADSIADGWSVVGREVTDSTLHYRLLRTGSQSPDLNSFMLRVYFKTFIARDTIAKITLDEVNFNRDVTFRDCMVPTLKATDTVIFVMIDECGDSTLRNFLNSKRILEIVSLRPNPASADITVDFNSLLEREITLQVYDDLGRVVYKEKLQTKTGTNTRTIPIPPNWSGTFYLRLQMGKDVVTGKFVKQ